VSKVVVRSSRQSADTLRCQLQAEGRIGQAAPAFDVPDNGHRRRNFVTLFDSCLAGDQPSQLPIKAPYDKDVAYLCC